MNKTEKWIGSIIAVIVLLVLMFWYFGAFDSAETKAKKAVEKAKTETEKGKGGKDLCPEKTAQILSLQTQVSKLQGQISTLTTENESLKDQNDGLLAITSENARLKGELIDCLKVKVASKSSSSSAGKSTGSTKAAVKPSTGTSGTATANRTKAATIPKSGTPSSANLDGLRENGIIPYCIMANGDPGLHFPEKALEKGVTFTSTEMNPTNNGHNWIVEPVEFIEGDYGLTVDGTFFVSNDLLVKVLQPEGIQVTTAYIKAPCTQWQKVQMTFENGYWTYKAF
ncbi:MAG: hypothetical protein WCT50_03220 [Patescibacteria group bacterium]